MLGTGTVLVPWALLAGLSGDRPLCGGLLLLFAVITLVRNVAEPHLVSRRIGLPPLLSLAAMYAGLRAAGLPGLLLFPLALTVLLRLRQDGGPGKQNVFSVLRFRKKDDIL